MEGVETSWRDGGVGERSSRMCVDELAHQLAGVEGGLAAGAWDDAYFTE